MGIFRRLFGSSGSSAKREGSERHADTGRTVDDGIAFLLSAIRDDNLTSQTDFDAASENLKAGGVEAADALAALISELLYSRSAKTSTAVAAARGLEMTPDLTAALKAVVDASELRPGFSGDSRFTPEIFGDGKIGWTSGTAARTRDLAEQVLGVERAVDPSDASPEVLELVEKVRGFAAGQEHATTVTETGKRVGPKAAAALQKLIDGNSSGPMANAVVYAVKEWEPDDAIPFIRHALRTGYPGAEYYGAIYTVGHPTDEIRKMARECFPKVRDDDARRMLGEIIGN